MLDAQLVEQRLGVLQVGSVEAFGEPVVDRGKHRARFVAVTLFRKQSGEAYAKSTFDKTIFTCLAKSNWSRE